MGAPHGRFDLVGRSVKSSGAGRVELWLEGGTGMNMESVSPGRCPLGMWAQRSLVTLWRAVSRSAGGRRPQGLGERERREQLLSGTGGTYSAFFSYVCSLTGMWFIVPPNS